MDEGENDDVGNLIIRDYIIESAGGICGKGPVNTGNECGGKGKMRLKRM
jgi:hypothetical protein